MACQDPGPCVKFGVGPNLFRALVDIMPCSVSLATDASYAEATYFGNLTTLDLEGAAREIMTVMQRSNTSLLLADCSGVLGGHSVFDLYALADWLKAFAPSIREAVVLPTLDLAAENVRFWETTCRNRGLAVRIFNDRQSALDWLRPSSTP